MNAKILTLAASVAMMTPSIANAEKLRMIVTAGDHQVEKMDRGMSSIDSRGQTSFVRIKPGVDRIKKRGTFEIAVFNNSGTPFNIGPENVQAQTVDGNVVGVITYEQLMKEERGRKRWAAVFTGLAALGNGINAANQGYGSGTATYRSNTYGTVGGTNFSARTSGFGTYSYQDPVAQQMALNRAQYQNDQLFAAFQASNDAHREQIETNLRTTTVEPGQAFGGLVTFELPESARKTKVAVPVRLVVDTGGEKHVFNVVFLGDKMAMPAARVEQAVLYRAPSTVVEARQPGFTQTNAAAGQPTVIRAEAATPTGGITAAPAYVAVTNAPSAQMPASATGIAPTVVVNPGAGLTKTTNPILDAYQRDLAKTGAKDRSRVVINGTEY